MAGDSQVKVRVLGDSKDGQRAMRDYARSVAEAEKASEQFNTKLSKSSTAAIKILGTMPGIAAAAGAATGIALAGVPLIFAAIGAAALSSNAKVNESFQELAEHVKDGVKSAAQPLEGTFVKALDKVDSSFARLQPQVEAAMAGSAGSVLKFTDGITNAAENAMPGFVVAVQNSYAPMVGLSSLLQKTGSGVTDFFTNLSQGASSSGQILDELGNVARDFLGFAGQLFANLSNNGVGVFNQLNGVLNQAYQIILKVSNDGMPAANGAFSGFVTIISGALGILNAVTGALGGWLGPLAQVAGSLKAVDLITFGAVTRQFDGLGAKLKEAPGFAAKAGTALGTVLGAALTPGGLAVAALAVGLTLLGQQQQAAADRATTHKNAIQTLTAALREDNGVVGEASRAAALKIAVDKNAIGNANALRVSTTQTTDAMAGSVQAYNDVTTAADNQIKTFVDGQQGTDQFGKAIVQWGAEARATGKDAAAMSGAMATLPPEVKANVEAYLNWNATLGDTHRAAREVADAQQQIANENAKIPFSTLAASEATSRYNSALQTLRDVAADAATKGTALMAVLDQLNGRTPSYEEAQQTINDTLRSMSEEFGKNIDKAQGFGAQLVNLDGTVNTTTANGSNLQNQLVTLQGGFANSGAAIQDLVGKGMSLSDATNKVNGDLGVQQGQLVGVLQKAGLTKGQIDSLIRTYGLVPNQVTTNVLANTAGAENAINYVARDRTGHITMIVRTDGSVRVGGGNLVMNETGNILAFANGGRFSPMRGGLAQKVQPNTFRLIGDNAKVPESYIPWDRSARSMNLLAETADAMGMQLSKVGGGSDGTSYSSVSSYGSSFNYSINISAGTVVGKDGMRELSESVRQEIERTLKRNGKL